MQRQSLGGGSSPAGSKHHHHHSINGVSSSSSKEVSRLLFDDEEEETSTPMRKEEKRGGGVLVVVSEIEEEVVKKKKKKKGDQKHVVRSRSEKSIHLIPILTIFCLLILYLCSYDPPLQDLAHIDGFRRISKRIDSTTTNEINSGLERLISSEELDDDDDADQINNKGVNDGDVLIRSHRSLHEIPRKDDGRRRRKWNSHRFHRKIGDYYSSHSSSSFM